MVLKLRLYCKSAGRQDFNLDPDFLFGMFPKSILQRFDRHSFLP